MRLQLSGGGLDSTALTVLDHANIDVVLHLDYGQIPAAGEWAAVERLSSLAPTVQLKCSPPWLKRINPHNMLFHRDAPESFMAGRNLALLQEAVGYALSKAGASEEISVKLGLCHEDMMFSDADREFVEVADEIFRRSYGSRVKVCAPYIAVPKLTYMCSTLERLSQLNLSTDTLWSSFTCWTPDKDNQECKNCYHCAKKQKLRTRIEGA